MDVIAAYRDLGSYRGAAAVCATTPKTVKRIIEAVVAAQPLVEAMRYPWQDLNLRPLGYEDREAPFKTVRHLTAQPGAFRHESARCADITSPMADRTG